MTAARLDATLAALADPTRREMVHLLCSTPSVTASELSRRLPLTRQAIAKHLAALLRAGLVAAARQGRETRYRLTPDPLVEVSAWLDEVGAEWDARLARLQAAAGDGPAGRR